MRTREPGIRVALGATSRSLTILVLRESVVLVGLGLCVWLLPSCLGENVIRDEFSHWIRPHWAVGTLILLLAIAAGLRPALRAARVDWPPDSTFGGRAGTYPERLTRRDRFHADGRAPRAARRSAGTY